MSPWGWWVDATRKINEARRLIGESLDCRMDVYGTDDDAMAVADAVQDQARCEDPLDPNECGCGDCAAMVARIRAVLAREFRAQRHRQIADLDYAFGLPAYRGQR